MKMYYVARKELDKYSWQQINESKVLHMHVLTDFLTDSCSRLAKYVLKTSYKDLNFEALTFEFLLVPFESKLINNQAAGRKETIQGGPERSRQYY